MIIIIPLEELTEELFPSYAESKDLGKLWDDIEVFRPSKTHDGKLISP